MNYDELLQHIDEAMLSGNMTKQQAENLVSVHLSPLWDAWAIANLYAFIELTEYKITGK